MALWYDSIERKTDEATPIPIDSGTAEAFQRMHTKIETMPSEDLIQVWESLGTYSPCDYYDREGKIGMDAWATAIYNEMSLRRLRLFS